MLENQPRNQLQVTSWQQSLYKGQSLLLPTKSLLHLLIWEPIHWKLKISRRGLPNLMVNLYKVPIAQKPLAQLGICRRYSNHWYPNLQFWAILTLKSVNPNHWYPNLQVMKSTTLNLQALQGIYKKFIKKGLWKIAITRCQFTREKRLAGTFSVFYNRYVCSTCS